MSRAQKIEIGYEELMKQAEATVDDFLSAATRLVNKRDGLLDPATSIVPIAESIRAEFSAAVIAVAIQNGLEKLEDVASAIRNFEP